MPITIDTVPDVVHVTLSGRLQAADYEVLAPEIDRLVAERGKIRMLVVMHDFHGWSLGAVWQDTKFAAGHFRDVERLALVGETRWQEGMAVFCKPFTAAKVRYFDQAERSAAEAWATSDG